jgi:hypothetical protein
MTIKDLADHIVKHFGKVPYHYGDDFTVSYHTRSVLNEHMHITEQHILECCERASNYEQYIEICRPLAKTDTEAWHREWNKPPVKGRTHRRFR